MKKNGSHSENPLIGKFFHSLNSEGNVEWQGCVVGSPEPGWYLLQLCEWMMGEPNVMRLVRIEEMNSWLFYPNSESMTHSYDEGAAREGGPYRKKISSPTPDK